MAATSDPTPARPVVGEAGQGEGKPLRTFRATKVRKMGSS